MTEVPSTRRLASGMQIAIMLARVKPCRPRSRINEMCPELFGDLRSATTASLPEKPLRRLQVLWTLSACCGFLTSGIGTAVFAQGAPSIASSSAGDAVQLQDLTFSSGASDIARTVWNRQPGSYAVGRWHDGRADYAGLRDGVALSAEQVSGPNAALFEIGSITKVFTGLLLAQAVERGDLSLDQTLGSLLEGKAFLNSPTVAAVTLRQLITHTSCLPRLPADFRDSSDPNDPYRYYGRDRLWKALTKLSSTRSPPCEPVYSNLGVAIVGEILSEHYGKSWDDLVAERITGPVGMVDTVRSLGLREGRLAPGFKGSEPARPWEMDAFRGAGSLRSTPADLLRFGRALLAGRSGPLGAAAERLLKPLAWFDGEIGYAIFIRGPEGRRTFMHSGSTGGYVSELVLEPDTGDVLVILASNTSSPVMRAVDNMLSRRYPVTPGSGLVEGVRVAEYAGVYQVDPTRTLTYTAQDGVLYYHYTGGRFVAMSASEPDVFTIGTRALHRFKRVDGKVSAVVASGAGADFDGVRTEERPPTTALLPTASLKGLAGIYKSPTLTFDVRDESGQLMVRVGKQPSYPVFVAEDDPDHFVYDIVKAELRFERYANGEARSIELFQNGHRYVARRAE